VFRPAIEAAQSSDAALILASDPDADRLAVAVRGRDGRFQTLTGNQLGALLTDYILRKRQAAGTLSPRHFVVETLVTTPLIAAVARSYGVRVIDDLLVGFKYIGATIDAEGPDDFVFGVEESLGYLAGSYARDKDAAVAALYALELAAELRQEGQTLLDRLAALFAAHGTYLEDQVSWTCPGPQGSQQIARLMQLFRARPPERIGSIRLERVNDYLRHEVRALPGNVRTADLPKPSGDVLMAEGESNGCRVRIALRPSGTEPKIKFYLFVHRPASRGAVEAGDSARVELERVRGAVRDWAGQAIGNGG
jgi:phosphoglucomutase/phosphomannomutase